MMSPYLQRPLHLGADIVYDSGTKYLSGHHDVMAGIIAVEREDVGKRIAFMINSTGTGLAPQDCFLLLRGLKTLSIRMERIVGGTRLWGISVSFGCVNSLISMPCVMS
jgi:cystathionine beta-lyase/cystathionine gamma-synthase